MMDRFGSFAVVAALVLASALHIVSAPDLLNIVPAILLVVGIVRIVMKRGAATVSLTDELAPAVEA
ncbi:hypothetical protein U1872_01715 [Sphingomonas sp. RB3P16]|uniref:hypothetical protein n=1 Tax=Parasphingomonas frigoris TaxID=3096163 RepID=UPI002FCCAD0B